MTRSAHPPSGGRQPVVGRRRVLDFFFSAILVLSLILIGAVSLGGCATTQRRGGATLSDAGTASARKAENKEDEQKEQDGQDSQDDRSEQGDKPEGRTRDSTDPPDPEDQPLQLGDPVEDGGVDAAGVAVGAALVGDGASYETQAAPTEDEGSDFKRFQLTPLFSLMGVAGDAYDLNWSVGLEFGDYVSDRVRVEGGLQYVDVEFTGTQEAIRGLEQPWELQLDMRGRFYGTGDHTFVSFYAVAGFKVGLFGWDFVEPLEVLDENGNPADTVTYDYLWTWTPYLGAGIAPIQWGNFHLGGSFNYGIRIPNGTTVEGFENDLFPAVGTWELRFDASLFF